jgi:diaminopimelate decarboxylase
MPDAPPAADVNPAGALRDRLPDHVGVAAHPGRWSVAWESPGTGERARSLHLGGVDLERVAQLVGTPTYVYGAEAIAARYRKLAGALAERPTTLCYALKANPHLAIVSRLAALGAGADIVSGGELTRALRAGVPPARIVFSGVGKSDDEIDRAIAGGIRALNIESAEELARVEQRAAAAGRVADVALRLNPDVDPQTHPYLATGLQSSKFGIAMDDAPALADVAHAGAHTRLVGLACHIGSQIHTAAPFGDSFARMRPLVLDLLARGVPLHSLDLGGGIGVPYAPDDPELDVAAWGRALVAATRDLPLELVLEPGRYLVANAGVLLTRVVLTKRNGARRFVVVDAAMNDLLRPALYQAVHAVVPVQLPASDARAEPVDVVGPVCECGDFLAEDRPLTPVARGDLLAVLSAGAYGMSMASTYNSRPLAAEVLIEGGQLRIIRPRVAVDALLADERLGDEPAA